LTLLSLDLSGHLSQPKAALRCMKANFVCITIEHTSGHNKCKVVFNAALVNLNMEDILSVFLPQELKSSEKNR